MSHDYAACLTSQECLFGLSALDKIKFLVPCRIVRVQVPPSEEETVCQICTAVIGILPFIVPYKNVTPSPGECTRSAMLDYEDVTRADTSLFKLPRIAMQSLKSQLH
ncbi:hypothetical protein TNCV_4598511 [Trichonephila clavipes]|nr:hypothetical protein TNCV_4598511 [Trichonephila clavipes]